MGLRPSTPPDAAGIGVTRPTRLLLLGVTLLTLALYLVSARGIALTPDERIVFDTTAALRHGRIAITTSDLDNLPGLAVRRSDGRRVGIYGIGTSAVALPLFEAGKLVSHLAPESKRYQIIVNMTMFTGALLTAATVFMLMLTCLLLGAPPVGAVLIGLAYGVGSFAYPHAATLFTEPGTALFVISAAYFAFRAARTSRGTDFVLCGVCAATALLFRASAVLFLPLFGVFCVAAGVRASNLRRGVEWGAWYTAGAVGPLLLLFATNWWRYGSPTNFGYTFGKATRQSYPILRGLSGQWLSSGKSIFLYAPIVIVVVLGLWWAVRRAPMELGLLGAIVLANTLYFARVQFWSGDWAWGPRYMQIVLPCLAAMAAPLMISRLWRRAVLAVTAVGFLFAALPAVLVRFTYLFNTAYAVKPPDRPSGGPTDWDNSYYALIWHTWRFQPIRWHLARIPDMFTNTRNASGRRFDLWWLRPTAYGWGSVLCFWVLPTVATVAGIWMLRRYRSARDDEAVAAS